LDSAKDALAKLRHHLKLEVQALCPKLEAASSETGAVLRQCQSLGIWFKLAAIE